MNRKFHVFTLAYIYHGSINGLGFSSRLVCREKKQIEPSFIEENKKATNLPANSVLLSVSYLGYMAKEDFDA